MKVCSLRIEFAVLLRAVVVIAASVTSSSLLAVTLGHVDDFQSGTTEGWLGANPDNIENAGPDGSGDNALQSTATGAPFGASGKLIIFNSESEWLGNWTSAGVARIAMDVRNPNDFALSMRLAIAGPDGFFAMGGGDTYITDPISVAPDNLWHSISFDVLAEDFRPFAGIDINTALADVTHFRILHNPDPSFIGATIEAGFLVDNISLLGASVPLAADYNGNGEVDAADYAVWRNAVGAPVETGEGADGSGPGGMPDGVVDQLDYDFWHSQFGNMTASEGHIHGLGRATSVVPEPGTLLLFLTAIAFLAARVPLRKEPAN